MTQVHKTHVGVTDREGDWQTHTSDAYTWGTYPCVTDTRMADPYWDLTHMGTTVGGTHEWGTHRRVIHILYGGPILV